MFRSKKLKSISEMKVGNVEWNYFFWLVPHSYHNLDLSPTLHLRRVRCTNQNIRSSVPGSYFRSIFGSGTVANTVNFDRRGSLMIYDQQRIGVPNRYRHYCCRERVSNNPEASPGLGPFPEVPIQCPENTNAARAPIRPMWRLFANKFRRIYLANGIMSLERRWWITAWWISFICHQDVKDVRSIQLYFRTSRTVYEQDTNAIIRTEEETNIPEPSEWQQITTKFIHSASISISGSLAVILHWWGLFKSKLVCVFSGL